MPDLYLQPVDEDDSGEFFVDLSDWPQPPPPPSPESMALVVAAVQKIRSDALRAAIGTNTLTSGFDMLERAFYPSNRRPKGYWFYNGVRHATR
jgi:hypothetical protein